MSISRSAWKKIGVVAVLVVVLLAVLRVSGVLGREAAPEFVTAEVARGTIEDTVLATGEIEPLTLVSVGARASGQVVKLHVKVGDRVRVGQRIADIDSLPQQNTLRNAEAALQNVRAQRAARAASLRQSELNFARQTQMFEADATSRQDYDAARASLDTARADIAALDAQIRQGEVAVDTARLDLNYTRINAPSDGVVVAVITEEGRTVNAFQSAPTIVMLANLDVMRVKAQISEADVVRVRPGQRLYFTILGKPDKRFYATLRGVEPAPESIADKANGPAGSAAGSASGATDAAVYYTGLFELPNPDGELRPSMTAQVYIIQGEARNALIIPATALGRRERDGRYEVRVVDGDGRAETRLVRIGLNNKMHAQVLAGLRAGEKVVIGDAAGATPGGQRAWR